MSFVYYFKEWCNEECTSEYTNEEYIDLFIDKMLYWLKRQNKINSSEKRQLKLIVSKTQFRKDIQNIIYKMR
tara:strand:- start:8798 stop:9013 length:216 start_codon:yes stop_codon:yes gene_type:complete